MNNGWRTTISQLYRKKTVKSNLTSPQAQSPSNSKQNEGRILDESNTLKVARNKVMPETNINNAVAKASCECCNCNAEKVEDRPLSNKSHQNRGEMIISLN